MFHEVDIYADYHVSNICCYFLISDIEGGFAYPDVSYCIPFSWILSAPVLKFSQSRGNYIYSVDLPPSCDGIEDIWKLKSKCTPDCMLQSKL